MALSIGKVFGLLELTDNFTAKIDAAAQKLGTFGANAEKIGRKISGVGDSMTTSFTLPLVVGFGAAAKASIDYESAFAGVKKTMEGTPEQFAELSAGIRDMAKNMPLAAADIAKVAESAGALGIQRENVLGFTQTMVQLGATTNLTADDAATAMARFANIMGTPQTAVQNLGSALVDLGNNGASTEREIMDMALRIAGAGHTVKMSEGQVMGLANALSSVGIEAEMGGSAISKTMMNVAVAVEHGGDKLENFARVAGVSAGDFQKAWRDDAGAAFATFLSGLGKVEERGGNLLGTLAELGVSEQRMRDTLLRVAGAGDLVAQSMQMGTKAYRDNTALANEYQKRLETNAAKLEIFKNKVVDVAIQLGDRLVPHLSRTADALLPVLKFIESAIVAFSKLPEPVQTTAFAVLAFVAAIGPMLSWGGRMITLLGQIGGLLGVSGAAGAGGAAAGGGLAAGFATLGAALSALVVPAALAALAGAVWQVVGAVKGFYAAIKEGNGVEFLTKRDTDNWVRRMLGLGDATKQSIATITGQIDKATVSFDAFANKGIPQMTAALTGPTFNAATSSMAKSMTVFDDTIKAAEKSIRDLSPAVRNDLVKAIQSGAFGMDDLKEKSGLTETALQMLTERVKKQSDASEKAAQKTQQHADAMKHMVDSLTGADKIAAASEAMEALAAAEARGIPLHKLTAESQKQIQSTLDAAIAVHKAAGTAVPQAWVDISTAVTRNTALSVDSISDLIALVSKLPQVFAQIPIPSLSVTAGLGDVIPGVNVGMPTIPKGPSFLSRMFGTPEEIGGYLSSSIMRAIEGGGSIINAAAGTLGQHFTTGLAKSLTGGLTPMLTGVLGGAVNAILPGLGSLLGPLTQKLFDSVKGLFDRNKGRDLVVDFADSLGGFDATHAKLLALGAAGEQLWIRLTQGVGRNNKDEAAAAIKAVEQALDDFEKKQKSVTDTVAETTAAQSAAHTQYVDRIKADLGKLDGEYQSLFNSVKDEAPEEAMGVVEKLAREQMAVVQDQRIKLEEELHAALDDISSTEVDPVRIPYYYDLEGDRPEGIPAPAATPSGSSGSGGGVTPAASGPRSQTVSVYLDGRKIARSVVQHMPEELELHGA